VCGKSSVDRQYNLSICMYSMITMYLPVDRQYNLIYVSYGYDGKVGWLAHLSICAYGMITEGAWALFYAVYILYRPYWPRIVVEAKM
jgi:hypothetical protein